MRPDYLRLTIYSALALLFSAPFGLAQDKPISAGSGWEAANYRYMARRPGLDLKGTDGETLIATKLDNDGEPEAGSVAFVCNTKADGGSLFIIYVATTDQVPIRQVLSDLWMLPRFRVVKGKLTIDGSDEPRADYTYGKHVKALAVTDTKARRTIYNAVLRGQTVELDSARTDPVTLYLPKPNEDFKWFGEACGLGLGARRG